MQVAVVITVKNEARLLRQNVLYHLGLGMAKVFVYLDHTTDNGAQTIQDIAAVEINNSVAAETYRNRPYLEKFWDNAEAHHTARQCLNTFDALQKCKTENIDWLLSLDADELFLSSKDQTLTLHEFFKIVNNRGADIVTLKPLEVVARKMVYQNVMKEETLFKTQKNFKSKFDQIYNNIYDPYQKEYRRVPYWLGHTMGKSAIKVTDNIIPNNVHRYTSINGEPLHIVDFGYVLHYHIYDFEDFIKKYQNFKERPDTFLSGNKIEGLKSLWIKLVNDSSYSKDYLKAYFKNNLLFNTVKLKQLHKTRVFNIFKRREPAIITINLPKQILTASKNKK
ncbi:glycosyltransferase family 2 protein [Winogradskyella forsetii]|uniref:glycosyltransferase family 2 protein n=1 Tax=Winogradskyella forsetii TaxID=2686077 RepID=UPI0015BC79B9|nr:glycosyltransferase family 2 protein [Winogradskyella forsetii]